MLNSSIINKYISKNFLKTLLNVSLVFLCLTTVLNLFEEVNFFKDHNVNFLVPLTMSFLKISSLLTNLFPFIILITTVFMFVNLIRSAEITAIRSAGISNLKIILVPCYLALMFGIIFFNSEASVLVP